jgi:glycosyltransferase involved in cell wall biosynthesis
LSKRPRIAFIVAGFAYPDVVGGAELFVHKLSVGLAKKGLKVYLIAARGPYFRTGLEQGVYRRSVYVGKRWYYFGPSYFLFSLTTLIELLKVKPAICVAIMGQSFVPCMIYSRMLNKPVIIRWAGTDYLTIKRHINGDSRSSLHLTIKDVLLQTIVMGLAKHRAHHVVLDRDTMKALLKFGESNERIHLIPNYITDEFFTVTPSYDGFDIVFVGRLIKLKGADLLIKAFAELIVRVPAARLILVGDGPEKSNLQCLAEKLGLIRKIIFNGFVPHSKVRDLLREASVFVLPSRFEGLPNSLLQAMAAGLPCVATAVGGVPDVIKDGRNGVLVPPEREDLLAEALETVLLDKNLARKLGKNARCSVSHLRLERIVDSYYELMSEMLDGQND